MKIVGINDGHNSSVALVRDRKIVFALSEERPTRTKNYYGFPSESIDYIFANYCPKDEIDFFGIFRNSGADFLVFLWGNDKTIKKFRLKWFLKLIIIRLGPNIMNILDCVIPKSMMINYYAERLGVAPEKIILVNHHLAHAESADISLDKKIPWLIFTLDGEGDLESGAVFRSLSSKLEKLTSINRSNSLGYFFLRITEYLGMKPNEHEFKVMGLEPYVRKNTKEYLRVFNKLNTLFFFNDKDFKSSIPMTSMRFKKYLRKILYLERFDNIAAASQVILENVAIQWIRNWINLTKISNIALSGGIMMNVKLAQKISALTEVNSIYVMPSSGDETTVFGVCNFISKKKFNQELDALEDLYLGRCWSDEEISTYLDGIDKSSIEIIHYSNGIEVEVAKLLAAGEIVARFSGRDEFGARALGNRSILAHPSNPETISTINRLIKDRDFWMPFTPSMIFEIYMHHTCQ
jgi:carbamoyltransferase